MKIRIGYELIYEFPQPTPMILTLNVHYTRVSDLVVPDHLIADPPVPIAAYRDSFGNWCSRIVAPDGRVRLSADALVQRHRRSPTSVVPRAQQHAGARTCPTRRLVFLLGQPLLRDRPAVRDGLVAVRQRADRLGARPGDLRLRPPPHRLRLRACARRPRRPARPSTSRTGVCRDYAHLAIAFCRCMNIPARYCTGYLGDIGVPPPVRPDGFRRLVRGLPRRPLVHLRRPQQHAAHRPRPDRPRPRRRRRRHHHHLRSHYPEKFQGSYRRSERGVNQVKGSREGRVIMSYSVCIDTRPSFSIVQKGL